MVIVYSFIIILIVHMVIVYSFIIILIVHSNLVCIHMTYHVVVLKGELKGRSFAGLVDQ